MAAKTKAKAAAPASIAEKAAEAVVIARAAAAKATTWDELWNAVYGIGAPLGELFPTQAEREAFARTEESRQIDEMLEKLRGKTGKQARFVLRLPRSMYDALKAEAEAEGVSVNMLCVAKLGTKLQQNLFIKC